MEIELTETDLWLMRDAIAFALRQGFTPRSQQTRLVEICESVLLRAALNFDSKPTPQ